ncbi:MAG: TonB-dependent receptor [Lysobacteraceae bacterium]
MLTSLFLVAAAAAADGDPAARLDRITVTARAGAQARERPEAVGRIDADTVERTGATHANELLNRIPGVWASRGSGQEQLLAIRSPVLTGPGACGAFLYLEDGVPIRPSGFCNVNQMFELNTEQAGRVEVLRGPGAAVHGSNALHGVINVIPRAPDEPAGRGVSVEFGPDRYARLQAGLGRPEAVTPWRVDVYALGSESFRDQEGVDQQKLSAQWSAPQAWGAPRLLLAFANLNQETAGFVEGFEAYRDARRFGNANPEAFRDGRAWRLQGRWSWALGNGMNLSWVPYLRRDELRFIQHFIPGKPLEETGSESIGSQLNLDGSAGAWQWRGGVDLEFARGSVLEDQPFPLTDASPLQNAIRPAGIHYDYRVDAVSLALFAEAERDIGVRSALLWGLRGERLDNDYDNRAAPGNLRADGTPCPAVGADTGGCLFNRPDDRRDRFDGLSAQLGLRHDPAFAPDWRLSARAARAFRFPQAAELYRLQRGQDVADLDNEVIQGVELGADRRGDAFDLSLAAYAYDKRNVILRDANGFNISDGRTSHRGLEADAAWRFAPAWWLQANASYAVQRYRFDRTIGGGETIVRGNEVDSAPRRLAATRLGHAHRVAGEFELEWVHQGGYFLDAGNTARYGGHDLFNLRWRQTLAADWHLGVRVMNLLDTRYAERADVAFGNFRYFPGAGRGVFVSLGWR